MAGHPSLACECFRRMCLNYLGVNTISSPEGFSHLCRAFPEGIPREICTGEHPHTVPLPGQSNTIVFQKASGYSEMEMFKPKRGMKPR